MSWIDDKRVVITGATSGIGQEIASRLSASGAHVVLACRDGVRAQEVASRINASAGELRASVMTVDTSDPRSVRAFAASYREAYGSADVVVNNAGVLLPERRTNVHGTELTFATNVLGYYLVATELLGVLDVSAPARLINVASTFAFDLDLDDLQFEHRPYNGMSAYAQSKACDRMLTWALARRVRPERVTVNAVAPGLVLDTDLYRHLGADARHELEQYGSRSIAEGAETAAWLATSDDVAGVTGTFFEHGAEIPCEFRDESDEERLWRTCERLTQELGVRT